MIYASLVVPAALLLFGAIGFGPALWLVTTEKRVPYALAVSPILGVAVIVVLGMPLVRYLAPIEVWAVPFAIFLIAMSLLLTFAWWRRSKSHSLLGMGWRASILPLGVFLFCYLVLISPLLLKGIQYTVFRSNPSDAFNYVSLAETLRITPWNVLMRAMVFAPENYASVAALGNYAPASLFTARAVGLPVQLNNMVALGFIAQIFSLPVYEAYYPFHLIAYLNTLLVALVLADMARVPRPLKYLGAAAIALGFWARFVLESDASYEINSMPMLLFVLFAWSILEQEHTLTPLSPARVLLAIAAAALACIYLILIPFVVVAFLIFYALNILRGTTPFRALLYHGVTAALVLLILGASGQLDFIYLNFVHNIGNVDNQRQYPPTVLELWRGNGVDAVWGMPVSTLIQIPRRVVQIPLVIFANLFGIALTCLVGLAFWLGFRRTSRTVVPIILVMVCTGVLFFVYTSISGNFRAAGKAFTYVYPTIALGIVLGAAQIGTQRAAFLKIATYTIGLWCVLQIVLGASLPFTNRLETIFGNGTRVENYDLSPITSYLQQNPPHLLLVNIPREKSWEFPFYTLLVFGRYPSYFQSGLVLDNSNTYQNFWNNQLTAPPDYAVTLKSHDYIARENWGTLVAETKDLALYRVTMQDVAGWNEQEHNLQALEASKPVFQQTLPLLLKAP